MKAFPLNSVSLSQFWVSCLLGFSFARTIYERNPKGNGPFYFLFEAQNVIHLLSFTLYHFTLGNGIYYVHEHTRNFGSCFHHFT
ncbi:hypothetical protein NC652_012978 [Populus alba x Populus x berolinensis]|nr:hypothetical protein NC652_012972 [Populus alba x Populus x berolinensis]KAJ6928972.1 hypothetical protein NC652_012978 [Populus alba x Populus x berolinensis]